MRLCSHVHARWPEQLTAKVSANARAIRDHPIVCEEEPPPPPPTPLLLRWCSFDTASATARNRSTLEQNVASMRRLVPCHYLSSGVCREKKLIQRTRDEYSVALTSGEYEPRYCVISPAQRNMSCSNCNCVNIEDGFDGFDPSPYVQPAARMFCR